MVRPSTQAMAREALAGLVAEPVLVMAASNQTDAPGAARRWAAADGSAGAGWR
jgi:hypothetical protein